MLKMRTKQNKKLKGGLSKVNEKFDFSVCCDCYNDVIASDSGLCRKQL